jgi:hypothetical protein
MKWSEEKWRAAEHQEPGRTYLRPKPEPIWKDAVAVLGIAAIGVLITGILIYALAGPASASYGPDAWGRADFGHAQRDTGSTSNGSSNLTSGQQTTWWDRLLSGLGLRVGSSQRKPDSVRLYTSTAQRQALYINDANKNGRMDAGEFRRSNGYGAWQVDTAGRCCVSYSNGGFGPGMDAVGAAAGNQQYENGQ